ncbi:hypothetical protein Q1695_015546 [Nippostrongylus brasiliensis]|nr:hypothetical protein Q1695_015546 [Nippostrongylus brasiliensis]
MARSRRMKCVEDSEPSSSETDGDENVELDEFQHIHDRRLCLGDFISNQKQTYPVERRRIRNSRSSAPKAESLECLELEVKKPFQLIDISVISRVPSTFIHVDFNLDCWTNFNFIEQNVFTVCWLDVHYHRALVDVTRVLPWSMNTGEMLTVMVLERYWKGNEPFLRLHLNTTTVSPKGDFDEQAFKTYMNRCHLSDVRDLIGATIRLLEKWRKQTIPPVDGKEQLIQKKEYLPMFNAAGFPLAQRLTMDYMVRILREETQRQHDQSSDAFDIITLKELEDALENSFPETLTSALSGAKCRSCGTDNVTELYEMEDFWNCRSCLKHFALRQIRSKFFPINIPLVVPEGVSSYDVLPSILPLPLFNFYTKLAATELITNASNGSIQLTDCPGCSQSVDISTQNEYSFVNCECGIVWCTKCKAEPHWPMPCEMAWQWRKQFEAYILGKGRPQRLRQIRCMCCGPPFTFYDHKRRVTCKTCNTTFDPQTMVVISRKGVVCRRRRTYFTLSDRFLPFTGIPPITRPIKRDIVEICLAARNYRFEIAKLNDLGRASGRLNESVPTLKSLRDMRQLFLYIIEYGTAWMYMEQSGPHGTSIRRTLIRLFLLYEKLTAANQYPRLKSEESVENFILRVLNTVDNIKKSL